MPTLVLVAMIMAGPFVSATLTEASLSVYPQYTDNMTGARVINLTPDDAHDDVFYQTHPMWTPGMEHFLFISDRDGEGARPYILEMKTGKTVPVAPDQAMGLHALAPEGDRFFFMMDRVLNSLDPRGAFGERETQTHAALPEAALAPAGGMSAGPESAFIFIGVTLGEEQWGIAAWEAAPDTWRIVAKTDFKVGHLQANPDDPNLLLFCHETGGDAPQRIWLLDVAAGTHAPFSKETYEEWVTHECWWGSDRVIFTIWPYDDERKQQAHGVLWADIETQQRHLLAQYPAWHTQGSPDRKWVLGDDFERNLWLIDTHSLERRLLTQGHRSGELATHPHASFTPDSKGIVFNSSKNGQQDIFLVLLPE
jgi:oligogalacturonide lyase